MATRWPIYSTVRFTTDDHDDAGALAGKNGIIIEVYEDAYEVQVSEERPGRRCS